MALTADQIAFHPALPLHRRQSQTWLSTLNRSTAGCRLRTQQRWLMAMPPLRSISGETRGTTATESPPRASWRPEADSVASRNTANSFIKGMPQTRRRRASGGRHGQRMRAIEPTAATVSHLPYGQWLTGNARQPRRRGPVTSSRATRTLSKLQPLVADGLLPRAGARAQADLFPVHLAQQWRHRHGLADVRHRSRPCRAGPDPDQRGVDRRVRQMAQAVAHPSCPQTARRRGTRQHRLARPARPFGDVGVEGLLQEYISPRRPSWPSSTPPSRPAWGRRRRRLLWHSGYGAWSPRPRDHGRRIVERRSATAMFRSASKHDQTMPR